MWLALLHLDTRSSLPKPSLCATLSHVHSAFVVPPQVGSIHWGAKTFERRVNVYDGYEKNKLTKKDRQRGNCHIVIWKKKQNNFYSFFLYCLCSVSCLKSLQCFFFKKYFWAKAAQYESTPGYYFSQRHKKKTLIHAILLTLHLAALWLLSSYFLLQLRVESIQNATAVWDRCYTECGHHGESNSLLDTAAWISKCLLWTR